MAAIITEQFRKNSADLLIEDIKNSIYYVGIGQQDEWDEVKGTQTLSPYPSGAPADERRVMEHLTGLFKTEAHNLFRVIPKKVITAGKRYKTYDPYDPTCFYEDKDNNLEPCYVLSGPRIFLCIHKDKGGESSSFQVGTSTVDYLSGNETNTYGVYGSEGHYWVYLGVIEPLSEINTNSFVDIGKKVDVGSAGQVLTSNDLSPISDQTEGMIYGFKVINGGNVYVTNDPLAGTRDDDSSLPPDVRTHTGLTVTLKGRTLEDQYEEETRSVTANINNVTGEIIGIHFNLVSYPPNFSDLKRWKSVKIDLTGFESVRGVGEVFKPLSGIENKIFPTIAPMIAPSSFYEIAGGFGVNKYDTLPSWYVAIYADTSISETRYLPTGTKYHQICLIKDPMSPSIGGDDPAQLADSYVSPLGYFELPSQITLPETGIIKIGPGWRILQPEDASPNSPRREIGVISHIQTEDNNSPLAQRRYYYYPDFKYGYSDFNTSGEVPLIFVSPDGATEATGNTANITIWSPGYLPGSGKVMFIDNRSAITREEGQNEELKIIIQL